MAYIEHTEVVKGYSTLLVYGSLFLQYSGTTGRVRLYWSTVPGTLVAHCIAIVILPNKRNIDSSMSYEYSLLVPRYNTIVHMLDILPGTYRGSVISIVYTFILTTTHVVL
jgi:hypothetical protein